MQKTFANDLNINGIGLHSGCVCDMVFKPAEPNTGIVFMRSDLNGVKLPALYSNVIDTRNCTCLGNSEKQIVSTIEHVMSALYILGVDNAVIEVNNAELPIMDGSAKVFYDELKKITLVEQNVKRKYIKVIKSVEFSDDKGAKVILSPSDDFYMNFIIDFPSKIVGHQEFSGKITEELFANEISLARTFCEKYQVDYLRSIGLIKGGGLDNAIVLDGDTIMNPEGFRVENECVKHKVLDCIGDMFTAGLRLKAKVDAFHSGHYHNNEVLKMLFANPENYIIVEE